MIKPFQQDFIRKGIDSNGWWHIKAETKGSYEITLRRWPKHLNHAIQRWARNSSST